MPIDKGGGLRGEGGTLADSTDITQTNLIINRSLFNYPIPNLTTDQKYLTPVDLSVTNEGFETDQYYVLAVGTDFLFCNPYSEGQRGEGLVQISLPQTLRKSFWDGISLNGWDYSFTSYNTRVRVNQVFDTRIEEHIWPPFQAGEVIYATKSNTADGNASLLVDVNDVGRSWIPYSPMLCLVKEVQDDVVICSPISDLTVEFPVAKPETLRRTGWDGQIVQGISYSYASPLARTATRISDTYEEEQEITPDYIEDRSTIIVAQLPVTIQVGAYATSLFDLNVDARAWAVPPIVS